MKTRKWMCFLLGAMMAIEGQAIMATNIKAATNYASQEELKNCEISNSKYEGWGSYDAASNKWIFTLCPKEVGGMAHTMIYDVATASWSKWNDEKVLADAAYTKTFVPGSMWNDFDYKNNVISQDFEYAYKPDQTKEALFYVVMNDQRAQYYSSWVVFKKDLITKKITFLSNGFDADSIEVDASSYTVSSRDESSKVPVGIKVKKPVLPKDFNISKLPVITPTVEPVYHAKLSLEGKEVYSVFAYERKNTDFVILKDVMSLGSKIVFNQGKNGVRTLSCNGKTVTLTKDDYCVTCGGNRMMVSTKVLRAIGVEVTVEYM